MKLLRIMQCGRLASLRTAQFRFFSKGCILSNDKLPDEAPGDKKVSSIKAAIKEAHSTDPGSVEPSFPSDHRDHHIDEKEYQAWHRDQAKHSFRPKVEPRTTSILLFPGQGSQFVGMGASLLKYPNVSKMYKIASEILGYDLLDVSTKGPLQKLNKTVYCQPAILVASLAAIEKLRDENPQAIENCVTAAGFSIGEIAALVFSGAMSFEDAVEIIKVRATAMQAATEEVDSGMMTVFLGPAHKIKFAMLTAKKYCSERLNIEKPVCQIANHLYTECKVVAGHTEALDFLETNKLDFGIKRTKRLPVSGAFHTPLMYSAREKVAKALKKVQLDEPIVFVHSNVNSHRYKNVEIMRKDLAKQVTSPVKWEQIMHVVYSRAQGEQFPITYEVGPGKQLGTLLRKTNKKAYESYFNVEV